MDLTLLSLIIKVFDFEFEFELEFSNEHERSKQLTGLFFSLHVTPTQSEGCFKAKPRLSSEYGPISAG